jgi:hypothetical protein
MTRCNERWVFTAKQSRGYTLIITHNFLKFYWTLTFTFLILRFNGQEHQIF